MQASTLGALEALLEFLRTPAVDIKVSGINIGPVRLTLHIARSTCTAVPVPTDRVRPERESEGSHGQASR